MEVWNIYVSNYGTFEFEGTEEQAEQKRRDKCRWEGAAGIKWRKTNQRESDRITEEMVAKWSEGKGVSKELLDKRREALNNEVD